MKKYTTRGIGEISGGISPPVLPMMLNNKVHYQQSFMAPESPVKPRRLNSGIRTLNNESTTLVINNSGSGALVTPTKISGIKNISKNARGGGSNSGLST